MAALVTTPRGEARRQFGKRRAPRNTRAASRVLPTKQEEPHDTLADARARHEHREHADRRGRTRPIRAYAATLSGRAATVATAAARARSVARWRGHRLHVADRRTGGLAGLVEPARGAPRRAAARSSAVAPGRSERRVRPHLAAGGWPLSRVPRGHQRLAPRRGRAG